MGVPRRYTTSFGIVLTPDEAGAVRQFAADRQISKAQAARDALEVYLDPRLSVLADTVGKPVREVARDVLDEYFANHPVPKPRKARTRR